MQCQGLNNKLYCDPSYILRLMGGKRCWLKMIHLIRKLPRTHSDARQSFIKQQLVTFLCKLPHWCVCTISLARLWALGEKCSIFSYCNTTTSTAQEKGWNTGLTVFRGSAVQWRQLNWYQGCSNHEQFSTYQRWEKWAKKVCSEKGQRDPDLSGAQTEGSPERQQGMLTPNSLRSSWPEALVRNLKDVGTSRSLIFGCQLNVALKESSYPHRSRIGFCTTEREHSSGQQLSRFGST